MGKQTVFWKKKSGFGSRVRFRTMLDKEFRVTPLILPQTTILNSTKLKGFEDDNFKFDEYGGKFSTKVENTVGKGEIARYEQFLLFPQCFQKNCIVWGRVNMLPTWLKLNKKK